MRIVLVDKDLKTVKCLKEYVKKCYPDKDIVAFTDAELALQYIRDKAKTARICFTSALMPKVSVFGITDELKARNKNAKVVLMADTDEYAAEAWRHSVSDYLITPITQECVAHTMTSCSSYTAGT